MNSVNCLVMYDDVYSVKLFGITITAFDTMMLSYKMYVCQSLYD